MAEELPSYASKVISVRPLTDDYLEILLEIPAGFTWEAGQYMRLGLPTKEVTDQKKVRALVKELHDTKSDRPVEVVYVADGFHLYQEDFEKWAADMPNLTLTLLDHGKDAVAHLTELAEQKGNEVRYYLSGSPAIVESNHDLLVNAGVDEDLVEVDKLYGY